MEHRLKAVAQLTQTDVLAGDNPCSISLHYNELFVFVLVMRERVVITSFGAQNVTPNSLLAKLQEQNCASS